MPEIIDFLGMGGYGRFVWPAFGLTAVVLLGLLFISLRQVKENERLLSTLQDQTVPNDRRRQS
jgi:heme exporter protein D